MTNKEIIIDGVNVSGCENLMQGIVLFGCMEDRKTCSCMNNPNCLYKQFKRKEQECEKYKQALDEIEKYLDVQQKYFDGEDYHNLLDIISKARGQINDR